MKKDKNKNKNKNVIESDIESVDLEQLKDIVGGFGFPLPQPPLPTIPTLPTIPLDPVIENGAWQ